MSEITEEQVEALGGWIGTYLGNYTLPANYDAPLYGQTHREVAKYCGPVIAEDLLTSPAFRAIAAAERAAAWDEAASLIEAEVASERERLGPDCDKAGLLGNWIGGFRESAKMLRDRADWETS